jgi:hypothetical protein
MEELWKLTPRARYNHKHNKGVLDEKAKVNLQQRSNFYQNKTKKDLLVEIFNSNSIEIAKVAETFEDFDYEFVFGIITTLDSNKRNKIFEKTFSYWGKKPLEEIIARIGQEKIINIFTWVKNYYPEDYENLVVSKWPEIDSLL